MKVTLTKKDKILVGITILLYVLGLFIGGWSIILNLTFLSFVFMVFRKSQKIGKLSIPHLIFLMIFIGIYVLIKIGLLLNYYQDYSIKKNYEKQVQKSAISTTPTSPTIPILNLNFELPTKLSKCGVFTFFVEDDNRTISGDFPTIPCSYDFGINSYSAKDKTKMGTLDIFMNIQGYVKRNNDYFYIRYYDGQIKETLIPKEANPEEIKSNNGIKMLRVKGTGTTIIQETKKQWIGGLLSTDQGVIINTGNDIFPALTIASDLKKTGLSEEEFLNILKSFKKN